MRVPARSHKNTKRNGVFLGNGQSPPARHKKSKGLIQSCQTIFFFIYNNYGTKGLSAERLILLRDDFFRDKVGECIENNLIFVL